MTLISSFFVALQLDTILAFWEARTGIERVILVAFLFFLFAGLTGLDGGSPKKLTELPLEEASTGTNPKVYFDMEIGGQKAGRIVMELFASSVPKTAENFVSTVFVNSKSFQHPPWSRMAYSNHGDLLLLASTLYRRKGNRFGDGKEVALQRILVPSCDTWFYVPSK